MVSLFLVLGLILGCSRESGVLQAPQANSEIKFLKPYEMQEFRKLNDAFLKAIMKNTLFKPAGLIEGKIKGGKLFRIIPEETLQLEAALKSQSVWELDSLQEALKRKHKLTKDLQGEVITTPAYIFYTIRNHLLCNALGFFDIDKTGYWMPDAIELSGRAEVLNKYLPEEHRLITKFYPASGREKAEEYLRNFAKDASLPLVDVDVSAVSMHDWLHQVTILYPPWLIESYRIYAQDSIDFIEYLQKRNFFDKFNNVFNIGQNYGYGETHWKDMVINYLYNSVGRDIDSQLGNFQNRQC